MNDREYLVWIHERLRLVHGESPLFDYMHKLRAIILAMPARQETANVACTNNVDDLLRELRRLDALRAEGWLRRLARRISERWTTPPKDAAR
jgi:hypothetical protein